MKTLITAVVVLAAISGLKGQNISIENDTVKWEVDQLTDTNASATMDFACQFITDKGAAIRWIQQNGEFVSVFSINASEGTWTDLNMDGYKEYDITYLGKQGKIRIERSGGSLQISMSIMEGATNTTPYIFRVTSLTKI